MEASELRISNRVMYSGSDWLVTGINSPAPNKEERWNNKWVIELYQDGLVNATIDEIDPIPLTEDVLLKCGFEELNYGWYSKNYFTDCKESPEVMSIKINLTTGRCGIGNDDSGTCDAMTGKIITHVHQLQNLHHALTGHELTINP